MKGNEFLILSSIIRCEDLLQKTLYSTLWIKLIAEWSIFNKARFSCGSSVEKNYENTRSLNWSEELHYQNIMRPRDRCDARKKKEKKHMIDSFGDSNNMISSMHTKEIYLALWCKYMLKFFYIQKQTIQKNICEWTFSLVAHYKLHC